MSQILEAIEDAFIEALESGANPPREFTVRLPKAAGPEFNGRKIQVAGYTLNLITDAERVRTQERAA